MFAYLKSKWFVFLLLLGWLYLINAFVSPMAFIVNLLVWGTPVVILLYLLYKRKIDKQKKKE